MLGDGCQATGKIAEARHVRELYLALYPPLRPRLIRNRSRRRRGVGAGRPWTGRGDAAAATRIVRGDASSRPRRGRRADSPRGQRAGEGILSREADSVGSGRLRRDADIPRSRVAAAARRRRGRETTTRLETGGCRRYLKFAPDAPEVAVAKVRLAKSYRAETDYVRPEFKKSLPLDKGAYDAEHADAAAAATAAIHYCESLQGAHKYVEVQAALRPAVVAAAASLGEGHERTCVLKRMLAYMVATKGVKGDVANGAWHVPLPDLVVAREMLEAAIAEAVATLGDAHEEVKALKVMAEEFEERKRWYHQFETGSLLNPGPPFEGFIPKTSPTQGPRFDSGWTHAADEPPKDPAPILGSHDDPFPADPWPAPAKMPPLAELEEQRITPTLSGEPVPLRNAPVRSRFGGLCLDGSVPFSGPPNPIRPPDGLRVLGEYTAEGRPMDAPPPPGRPTFGFGTNRPDDSMDLG